MPLIPTVIEKSGQYERAYDIYSRLLKDRIIFWASRLMIMSPTSLLPSFCFWMRKEATKILILHQLAGRFCDGRFWRFTIRCSTSKARCPQSVSVWQPQWRQCFWLPAPKAKDSLCRIPKL